MHTEDTFNRTNRMDARFVDYTAMRVLAMKMIELSKVGQSRVRAYQTVPRLQDRTAQRHQRRFWGRVVRGARCRYEIFGARSSDVLKRMQKAVLSSSLNIARTFNR